MYQGFAKPVAPLNAGVARGLGALGVYLSNGTAGSGITWEAFCASEHA